MSIDETDAEQVSHYLSEVCWKIEVTNDQEEFTLSYPGALALKTALDNAKKELCDISHRIEAIKTLHEDLNDLVQDPGTYATKQADIVDALTKIEDRLNNIL